jgi:hypothetical protein
MAKNLIKVHYKGPEMMEHLWAKPMKGNTARLMNIPFQDGISLHDVVLLDDELNIINLVKKKTDRITIRYNLNNKTLHRDWKKMIKYFIDNKIAIEGVQAGYASLAIPCNMKFDKLEVIINKSPIKIIEFGGHWIGK